MSNFSHVTMFTFNKDKRTASVNLLDDKYKVFKDVVELQLEKVCLLYTSQFE